MEIEINHFPKTPMKWYEKFPSMILYHCCHCGEIEITRDTLDQDELGLYRALVARGSLMPTTCIRCNEEISSFEFIGEV